MATKLILIITLLILPINAMATTWADRFFDTGRSYQRDGQYLDAAEAFEKAAKWELKSRKFRSENYIVYILFAGKNYLHIERCDKVIGLYNELLPYVRKDEKHLASVLNSLGECHLQQNRVDLAYTFSSEAIEVAGEKGEAENIAAGLANVAQIFQIQGKYSIAFEKYQQAIKIHKDFGSTKDGHVIIDQLSSFLLDWGLFSESIRVYQKDLSSDFDLAASDDFSNTALINIGVSSYRTDKFTKGETFLKKALERAKDLEDREQIAIANEHLGTLYALVLVLPKEIIKKSGFDVEGSLYKKTKQHYQASMEVYRSLQWDLKVAGSLLNIGIIDLLADNLSHKEKIIQAMSSFQEAFKIFSEKDDKQGLARTLHNIGVIFHLQGDNKEALVQFDKAVNFFEFLRKSIEGIDRWEVARRQLQTLEFQMTSQLALQDYEGLFDSMERSRIQRFDAYHFDQELKKYEKRQKHLTKKDISADVNKPEKVSGKLPQEQEEGDMSLKQDASDDQLQVTVNVSDLPLLKLDQVEASELKTKLSDDEVIISFGKTTWEQIAIAVLIKDEAFGTQSSNRKMLENLKESVAEFNQKRVQTDKGINIVPVRRELVQQLHQADSQRVEIEKIYEAYIRLLADPDSDNDDLIRNISTNLYDFLIKPVEEKITGKKRILIIAEGFLNLIPFGTLMDEKGTYLAERFEIRYTPAYGLIKMINTRKDKEEANSLLAFGDANYTPAESGGTKLEREFQLAFLQSKFKTDWAHPVPVREGYSSLGLGPWNQLSGSKEEVVAITDFVEGSHLISEDSATEKELKSMSRNEDLKNYRSLHFSVHGSIIGALPELSGLIFPVQNQSESVEDGFLQISEIENLELDVEYVNLSSIALAPGRIYSGYGVVQIVQAFLANGVDSLSMSFWDPGDVAKQTYMLALYEQVFKEGKNFSEASTIIRRKFISGGFGEEYRKPHYWSSFLHYGK